MRRKNPERLPVKGCRDGTPVVSLDELAAALDGDRRVAAEKVLTLPFGQAAPEHIKADAMSEVAE